MLNLSIEAFVWKLKAFYQLIFVNNSHPICIEDINKNEKRTHKDIICQMITRRNELLQTSYNDLQMINHIFNIDFRQWWEESQACCPYTYTRMGCSQSCEILIWLVEVHHWQDRSCVGVWLPSSRDNTGDGSTGTGDATGNGRGRWGSGCDIMGRH